MMQEPGLEETPLAKLQKSLMLHADLDTIVKSIEAASGANFTRIMTAALLKFLYSSFMDPEEGAGHGPDTRWIRIAVQLERGETTVADLPKDIIDSYVDLKTRYLKSVKSDQEHDTAFVARITDELRVARGIQRSWKNSLGRHDGDGGKAYIERAEETWTR